MTLNARRPLLRAGMVEGATVAAPERRGRRSDVAPPASAETERIEALTKLKGLLDSGVLTREQYDSERKRLTEEIRP